MDKKPTGPSEPRAPGPLPPSPPTVELKTIWDVVKILIAVTIWYITADANKALIAAVEYGKLSQLPAFWGLPHPFSATAWGGWFGLWQGLIQSVRVVVFFWAGPAFFLYLGPVLNAAFAGPLQIVKNFRVAWNAKVVDDGKNDSNTKP